MFAMLVELSAKGHIILIPGLLGLLLILQGYVAVVERQFLPRYAPKSLNLLNRESLSVASRETLGVITGYMSIFSGIGIVVGLLIGTYTPYTDISLIAGLSGTATFVLLIFIDSVLL